MQYSNFQFSNPYLAKLEFETKDNPNPFYIQAAESAVFSWEDSIHISSEKLLEQNAPALLLGYLRPIVAALTTSSPFSPSFFEGLFLSFDYNNRDRNLLSPSLS